MSSSSSRAGGPTSSDIATWLAILEKSYGLSRHGNRRDAFWELVFIIISVRTAEAVYKPVFRELKATYRTIDALASARTKAVALILKRAGLARLKARQLIIAASEIRRDFGKTGLTRFGRRNYKAMEEYLMGLPGVGAKVAKCVSMYSCDAPSLPVDAHVWRVMSRLGYATGGRLTESKAERLEEMVPSDLRFAAHVLCVSHGRAICKPRPKCRECPIASLCPSASRSSEFHQVRG